MGLPVNQQPFGAQAVSAATLTAKYADNLSMKGLLQRVDVSSNVAGSIFILESGTNHKVSTVAVPSGTNPTVQYPRQAVVNNVNAAIANEAAESVINGQLYYTGSGFTSGTANSISNVNIYWL